MNHREHLKQRGAAIIIAALIVLAAACGGSAESETARTGDATTSAPTPATASPGTEAPGTTAEPATTIPETTLATIAPTTAAAPSPTVAPTTAAAAPTTSRPPRPAPPKEGRPAPPENLYFDGPAAVEYEGQWRPLGSQVDGAPAMYSTSLRTNANGSVQAGAVWIDHTAVRAQLFPGLSQPGGSWASPPAVPLEQEPALLAAFNSGFLISEAEGGFYLEGREAVPLRGGTAGIHIDTNGTINVGSLGRDFNVDGATVAVRQNLPLLVDDRIVAASATDRDNYVWGKTLGGGAYVWRSGLGIRDDGTLVYIGGPSMSARSLGDAFVAVGAVRALQLDINPSWVTFNSFVFDPGAGRSIGTKLLPIMNRSADRYLSPDDRDFFAIFAR